MKLTNVGEESIYWNLCEAEEQASQLEILIKTKSGDCGYFERLATLCFLLLTKDKKEFVLNTIKNTIKEPST